MSAASRRDRALSELQPYIERARGFSGWTFEGLTVRHVDPGPPWDYEQLARDAALSAGRMLDLGTGGGEVLSRVIAGTSARGVATEEWHVNAPIAHRRLSPLGVEVLRCDSLRLPLRDASFDVVLDRHEALDPVQVARVLRRGGRVITQQVGPDNWPELLQFFPRKTDFGDHFNAYRRGFTDAGLLVADARWHEERVAFGGLGDVAYILLATPWIVPNFDPVAEIDELLALEDALRTDDGIVLTETRYIIQAQRPA